MKGAYQIKSASLEKQPVYLPLDTLCCKRNQGLLNQSNQLALTVCTITCQHTACFCRERPKCSVESLTGLIGCVGMIRRWLLYTNGLPYIYYGRSVEIISYHCYLEQTPVTLLYLFPRITRVGDIEVPQIRPARYIGPEKVITTSIFVRQFL